MPVALRQERPVKGRKLGGVVTRKRKVAALSTFEGIPIARMEAYARILLRSIDSKFSGAASVTRDDLLQCSEFWHLGTQSRYALQRKIIRFLASRGQITIKKRTDIILSGHEDSYSEEPLSQTYSKRIREIVLHIGRGRQKPFYANDVIAAWRSDALTPNNKRVAVRNALKTLVTTGVITEVNPLAYAVVEDSNG